MRTIYTQQLQLMDTMVVQMGHQVKHAVDLAISVLLDHNKQLAKDVIEHDTEINRQEKELQDLCLMLILKQQPVAKDLKHISSVLKMITDMERIGDHASDISEMVLEMAKPVHKLCSYHLDKMAKSAIYMLEQSLIAFEKSDLVLANQIWNYDDIIDELYEVVKKECEQAIKEDVSCVEEIVSTLLIAKYLEKMGDHAQNIVEWIMYALQ